LSVDIATPDQPLLDQDSIKIFGMTCLDPVIVLESSNQLLNYSIQRIGNAFKSLTKDTKEKAANE